MAQRVETLRPKTSDLQAIGERSVLVLPSVQTFVNKKAAYVLFTAMGALGGLFARDIIDGPTPVSSVSSGYTAEATVAPSVLYEATIAADIHDALFPTPSPTNTPAPTATSSPDPASGLNFCEPTTKVGELCKVPFPPPPEPTPYPSCDSVALTPGDWCMVRGTPTA